jgi:NNP family nitrate/nitrite transporter-like MFS transporter
MLASVAAFQGIPPVLSLILKEFHLSYQQGGMLVSMFALPAIILSLPSGLLSDRYGTKSVAMAALGLMTAGSVVVATGESYPALIAGRIVTGVGAVMLLVVAPQGIGAAFPPQEMGRAMGIFNAAGPMGILVSFNGLPALAARFGWRSSMWACAVFYAALLVLLLFRYRVPFAHVQAVRFRRGLRRIWAERGSLTLWLVGFAWAFFNGAVVALFSFCPVFLVSHGFTLGAAGFFTSIVVITSAPFAPISGFIADRTRRKELLIVLGGVLTAVSQFLIPSYMVFLVGFMMIIGACSVTIATPIYALATEAEGKERLGYAFGVLSMLNSAGSFVVPQLVGYSRDVTGSYGQGFAIMALVSLLVAASGLAVLFTRHKGYEELRRPASGGAGG